MSAKDNTIEDIKEYIDIEYEKAKEIDLISYDLQVELILYNEIVNLQHQLEEKDKIIKDLQQPFIFLKNRINQGMSEENIEKHLIRIGKNIIDNLERSKNEKV